MKIVLIGFMCSGKSRVGKLLAEKLGVPHFDTDAMIEKQVGASIAEIINKRGEAAFREVEAKAVALVGAMSPCVISTGGGVPLNRKSMRLLGEHGRIIWLRISPEEVLKRAGDIQTRPLMDSQNPLESVRTLMNQRDPYYSKAAQTIDVDGLTPQEAVQAIVDRLPARLS